MTGIKLFYSGAPGGPQCIIANYYVPTPPSPAQGFPWNRHLLATCGPPTPPLSTDPLTIPITNLLAPGTGWLSFLERVAGGLHIGVKCPTCRRNGGHNFVGT
eukprot:sb/3478302/